jgi:diguanylate cyclase
MTTTTYFESTLRSKELLKDTIAFIGTHQLAANPINYTVCYEYFLGNHLLMKQQIDQAISKKTPLTDSMMAGWFKDFLPGYDQEKLKQSQAEFVEVISKFTESATQVEDQVTLFNKALQVSEEKLGNNNTNASLVFIVADLLDNTHIMKASIDLMKQQIEESKQEITALHEKLERATDEALTDPLTGLTNRRGLSKSIEAAILSAEESKLYPCVLMIDIDHFKKINDTFGHLLGDRAIKIVGKTLKSQIKGKDTAARYGGEEFCVLLPETELTHAVGVAENIRRAVENMRIRRASDNQEICRMTISIGVACFKFNESITSLIERADKALYQSKNDGRNRVTTSDD